jgi:hypothetical protein
MQKLLRRTTLAQVPRVLLPSRAAKTSSYLECPGTEAAQAVGPSWH